MYTVNDVISGIRSPGVKQLPVPPYTGARGTRCVALAVESMRRHMTDEGWQVMAGLESAGYTLCGHKLFVDCTCVPKILARFDPDVMVVQDKREWEGRTAGKGFDERERFTNVPLLKDRDGVFKVTILKDAQNNPDYHRAAAEEMGCHAWIVYYNRRIVHHVAPYTRSEHLIRTYHTLDADTTPVYTDHPRNGAVLSGAMSDAYPLRKMLRDRRYELPDTIYVPHPGYHRNGCQTPSFMQLLTRFKVAICTASRYGYALRKIVEATACGCIVLTDLPSDEVMPEIDGNLVRVEPGVRVRDVAALLQRLYDEYNIEQQRYYADTARQFYDYRTMGARLAEDIERCRRDYGKEQL